MIADPTDLIPDTRYRITVEDDHDGGGILGTFQYARPDGTSAWSFGELGPGAFLFEAVSPTGGYLSEQQETVPAAEPDPFEPADPEPSPEDEPDPLA